MLFGVHRPQDQHPRMRYLPKTKSIRIPSPPLLWLIDVIKIPLFFSSRYLLTYLLLPDALQYVPPPVYRCIQTLCSCQTLHNKISSPIGSSYGACSSVSMTSIACILVHWPKAKLAFCPNELYINRHLERTSCRSVYFLFHILWGFEGLVHSSQGTWHSSLMVSIFFRPPGF